MNKLKVSLLVGIVLIVTSCQRVAPNYVGVLMENYGKAGKSDFSLVKGRVSTAFSAGSELFQVPLYDQRANFETKLTLKSADNTEFKAKPMYSYKVIEKRAIDVVFDNKQVGMDSFMVALENNVLEPRIYDLVKEESRKYTTDTLMSNGGSLKFEQRCQEIVKVEFEKRGLELIAFSAQLEFSNKVTDKIDQRNEVNTNITVLDQQIIEQRKKNELVALQRDYNKILSDGITPQLLQQAFIEKWDGHTPLYGIGMPVTLFKNTEK